METDIRKISIKLIDGFPNHPFYVFDDDEMSDLTESIRKVEEEGENKAPLLEKGALLLLNLM